MKKLMCLIIIVAILFSLSACGDEKRSIVEDNSITLQSTENVSEPNGNNSSILTIEYDVEDYVENAIIVSKNDGLLYGVIDNNGNVILPVEYDEIKFLNKDDYIDSLSEIYISARYEGMSYIFDTNGSVVLESGNYLGYVDYLIEEEITENKVIFYELAEDYNFYNFKGELLSNVPRSYLYDENYNSLHFINSNCFYCLDDTATGTLLYNFSGNLINHYKSYSHIQSYPKDDVSVIYFSNLENKKYIKFEVDSNGTVSEQQQVEKSLLEIKAEIPDNNLPYNLYESNNTWKMEDLNQNDLYEERYYAKYSFYEGENDCIFLTDEDNYLCAFGRQGNLYVEFGKILLLDDDFYFVTESGNQKISSIHEGKESIAIVLDTSNGSKIYFND